tara:strand:+ start:6767 stop:7801 length:1035 start_codon:yes stop_codon:yes gene_type:complete
MTILVTGGCGFIGSNFILNYFLKSDEKIINLDSLTYAGNLLNLESLKNNNNYQFVRGSINNSSIYKEIFKNQEVTSIINFAAESHVDKSILGPEEFINTNIIGTFRLLDNVKKYWDNLDGLKKKNFRFLHVSTDEVYGSLNDDDPPFTENNKYEPNSPYSASKASSDHLVRAYNATYGLPTLTTNCSNNYGPFQFPEKLIPLIIKNALEGTNLPIYGDGKQIRDWLYVTDHCEAINAVLENGIPSSVYNIGGLNEKKNIEIVNLICSILDKKKPLKGRHYSDLINYVKDRPGHDRRYAVDNSKIKNEIGWYPKETFHTGLDKTVNWYLDNQEWVKNISNGKYRE